MVMDHEKDLAEFEKEAERRQDPNVKSFAVKTAKAVRKHLEMAKEIDVEVEVNPVGVCLLQDGASQKARRFYREVAFDRRSREVVKQAA